MQSDEETDTTGRAWPRAVGTGVLFGVAVALVIVAWQMFDRAVPAWHRSGEQLPVAALGRWALVAAAVVLGLAVLDVVAVGSLRSRRVALVVGLAAVIAAILGIGWYLAHESALSDVLHEATSLQSQPEVLNLTAGFHLVTWVCGGIVVAIVVAAWIRHVGDGSVPRRWYLYAGVAAVVATLATTSIGLLVIEPDHAGPSVVAAQAKPFIPNEPSSLGRRTMRITPQPEEVSTGTATVAAVVPLPAGVALASKSALVAYAVDGTRLWSIDFPNAVHFAAGTERVHGRDDSAPLVQTDFTGRVGAMTYGIDGTTGEIAWSSDAVAPMVAAAGLRAWGNDPHISFAALIDPPGEQTTAAGRTAQASDLVMIDARTGTAHTVMPFRSDDCAVPTDVVVGEQDRQPVAVVADNARAFLLNCGPSTCRPRCPSASRPATSHPGTNW